MPSISRVRLAGGSCVNSASSDIRWLSPWASRFSARQRSTVQPWSVRIVVSRRVSRRSTSLSIERQRFPGRRLDSDRPSLSSGHRARLTPASMDSAINVALVVPLQGSAGIFGPSCELCAELAAAELNAIDGLLGRELRLSVIDGGAPPAVVADEVGALAAAGLVDAVVGWHISAVRQVVAPRVAGLVPYVYTALYEGGERTPGVFLTGEIPSRQLLPAMCWLSREHGVRRWAIVGNDYVWPRATAQAARGYLHDCRGRLCHEEFVPLGCRDWDATLAAVRALARGRGPDAARRRRRGARSTARSALPG